VSLSACTEICYETGVRQKREGKWTGLAKMALFELELVRTQLVFTLLAGSCPSAGKETPLWASCPTAAQNFKTKKNMCELQMETRKQHRLDR